MKLFTMAQDIAVESHHMARGNATAWLTPSGQVLDALFTRWLALIQLVRPSSV